MGNDAFKISVLVLAMLSSFANAPPASAQDFLTAAGWAAVPLSSSQRTFPAALILCRNSAVRLI